MAEGGDVFVLDMGKPVRIADLAQRMVELSGLQVRSEQQPWGQIEIQISGLRPGEKLYEELLIGDNPLPTQHPRILRAQEMCLDPETLLLHLGALESAMRANDVGAIRNQLQQTVHGYQPVGEVVDWLHSEVESIADEPAGTPCAFNNMVPLSNQPTQGTF